MLIRPQSRNKRFHNLRVAFCDNDFDAVAFLNVCMQKG